MCTVALVTYIEHLRHVTYGVFSFRHVDYDLFPFDHNGALLYNGALPPKPLAESRLERKSHLNREWECTFPENGDISHLSSDIWATFVPCPRSRTFLPVAEP